MQIIYSPICINIRYATILKSSRVNLLSIDCIDSLIDVVVVQCKAISYASFSTNIPNLYTNGLYNFVV